MKPLLSALLLIGLAGQAGAQSTGETAEAAQLPTDIELTAFLSNPTTKSADAYEVGVRLFEAKRYEAAEQAWLRAYALGRGPTLLVAVADTRQRRGDEPGAVAMLEQYLVERPDAPDRASVEARIATLLQSPAVLIVGSKQPGRAILLDGVPNEKKTPAELEVEKTEEAKVAAQLQIEAEDTTIRRAVIATGSIAAAALAAGTVVGILALEEEWNYSNDPSNESANKGERLALFADVSFGLAALSAITSFTLFMTHKNKRKRERETARLQIETRGAGAAATFRF